MIPYKRTTFYLTRLDQTLVATEACMAWFVGQRVRVLDCSISQVYLYVEARCLLEYERNDTFLKAQLARSS